MQKLSTLMALTALTCQPMPDYSFGQSEADTILISAYAVLFTVGPYVAAAAISQNLMPQPCA